MSKKKKRSYEPVRRIAHPNLPSITLRPEEIRQRTEYGHWEMDTVYSGKGKDKSKCCLLVLTERMTLDEYILKMVE